MKYLIISDIHGCLPTLQKALTFYREQHCDMLLILGDILNYGPRNTLPEGLNPKGIAETLNDMSADLAAIRGNCDSEVDQMPPHRQSLDIANANAFLSNFQRTASRTLKFLALDNPNQFLFAIFESLMLKSANFLCTLKQCGRHFGLLGFRFQRQKL